MNITKSTIKSEKATISISGQQSVNSDIILPDYYGNINKIMKCCIRTECEAININSDKISVAGIAYINVMYSDEEMKLYNYETELKYTKVLQCDGLEAGVAVSSEQCVISCNYRALGPKRLEVRGMLQITARIHGISSFNTFDSVENENIQIKKKEVRIFEPSCIVNRDFSVNDICMCDDECKISDFIRKSGRFNFLEIKTINDKTYIKGNVNAELVFCDTENNIRTLQRNIPVSEVIETFQSSENDYCFVKNSVCHIYAAVKENDNKKPEVEISAKINLTLMTGGYSEKLIAEDAYSLDYDTENVTSELKAVTKISPECCTFNINASIDTYDDIVNEICDIETGELKALCNVNDDKTEIIVSANLNILAKSTDGHYFPVSRSISDEKKIDIPSDSLLEISDCSLASIKALHVSENKIELEIEIAVRYLVSEVCKENVLTDISAGACDKADVPKGIVLYFAEKNEKIWNIAKHNRTTTEYIRSLNDIKTDVLDSDMLLVFPNI